MDAVLQRKLERCSTLPTLPAVALKVVQLCRRDDVDVTELVATMSADPALSAKVLKLVNSAAFGQRREVRTLSHAVLLIGTNALRALALSFSLVPDAGRRQRAALEAFWKRAVVSGVAGRELAVLVGFPLAEEAFLGALLQDIGMLALGQVLGPEYPGLLARAGDDNEALAALEYGTLATDHAEVGQWLLGRWNLPVMMCTAVGLSHSPGRLHGEGDAETAALVKITATAGLLADMWLRTDVAGATVRARIRARGLFEMSEEALQSLLSRIAGAMPEIAPMFELDLGNAEDIAGVVEQAKEILVMLNLRAAENAAVAQQTIRALQDRTQTLAQEALHDPLTGLSNRRALERYLDSEFAVAFDLGASLSVILCDVDRFKTFNDTYGHEAGDRILAAVAATLNVGMRPRDMVSRYGGEEFAVVLPNTQGRGAHAVSERLRQNVETIEIELDGHKPVHITMSFGHATATPGAFTSYAELLRAADDALYAAKRAGRNSVVGYAISP